MVLAAAGRGDSVAAWTAAAPLLPNVKSQSAAARALIDLTEQRAFGVDHALAVVRGAFEAHADDDTLLGDMGSALEAAHDMRFLNAPPPSDPLFERVALRLRDRLFACGGDDIEPLLQSGFSTAARLLGPAWDADAERAYRRLVELRPHRWQDQYNLGLFYKVRGRFAEGAAANQRAVALGGGDDDGVRWNLGICATGARDAASALSVWKGFGHRIEIGRFGLPEGPYDPVKVRLAQHPVAERGVAHNAPGLEETIWIERLSPCHGVVRSALVQDLGVDYGDVVLIDGAPVTHHKYGESAVPVFPHLATLERTGYRIFPFVGTQPKQGAIEGLSRSLPEDTVLYSHTEKFSVLCAKCWESDQTDHSAHRTAEHHVVRGMLCAPPSVAPARLREALDQAIAESPGIRVFVPDLSLLLGDSERAEVESRRMTMVEGR